MTAPSSTTPAPPPASRRPQRRDIEGLRAVAVVLVVASHLGGRPAGGFIGVDVFFVVSGFLITGLLVREIERSGRISFREFYARRVRRILPMALLVLAVTCLAARLLFFDSRAHQTYRDSVWAALSLENWHLAAVGTDYFASTLPPSPVQQYWSLSVEEQFYLAWPVLVVITAVAASRWAPGRLRLMLGATFGLVVVTSFTWAVFQSSANTTVAYFSTFTRAWELGVGGLLALLAGVLAAMPRWASAVLSWGGLAAIVTAAVVTRADSSFPAPGALPVVVGTAALIAGGSANRALPVVVLDNPVSRYVGRISYSVYLWHWPVIIFAQSLWDEFAWVVVSGLLLATVGLSALSYHLVEEPIRRTTWLSRPREGQPKRTLDPTTRGIYSGALVMSAVVAVSFSLKPPVPVNEVQPRSATSSASTRAGEGSEVDARLADWQNSIDQAVVATEWPDLQPSLDDVVTSRAAEWAACGNVENEEALSRCRFGTETRNAKTMVVIGDSIAISWLPALRAGFEKRGWVIQGLTYGECPPARIDVDSSSKDDGFTAGCAAHQRFALEQAVELQPDLIVLSDTDATVERISGAATPEAALTAWERAQADALKQLSAAKKPIVVLSAPPPRKDLVSCATKLGTPADCLSTIGRTWTTVRDMEKAVATKAGATFIDTSGLTCDAQSYCPGFIGTTPVMADGVHLTDALSKELGPLLYQQINDR
jgi:peptidoglycan/LPS O-acetylase OafA/YrhL